MLSATWAEEPPLGKRQQEKQFEKEIKVKVKLGYLLALPEGYEQEKKAWPLVLFLHGAGETGTDLSKVKIHGPPKLVEAGKKFPFILVSPQTPQRGWNTDALLGLLDEIQANHRVDPDRVYVTGLSMGGYGTWALAAAAPDRFAAAAPICGGGNPRNAGPLKRLPIWAFHGDKDNVVPLMQSQAMVDAIKAAGGNVKLTVYPGVGHDSWTATYENPEFYDWLLQQKRQLTTWNGTWEGKDKGSHGGELTCVARPIDGTNYVATFSGKCGDYFSFDIEMNGKKDGDKVKFAGEVDLGEKNGGVYRWNGEQAGAVFTGEYETAQGKKGVFELKLKK
jgi:dienelactone hydrolase